MVIYIESIWDDSYTSRVDIGYDAAHINVFIDVGEDGETELELTPENATRLSRALVAAVRRQRLASGSS